MPISLVHLCPDTAQVQNRQEGAGMAEEQPCHIALHQGAPCTQRVGTGRGTMPNGHWGLTRAWREQVGNKQEGKGKNAHCMQSQNQVHLAEPQQSNRATPSARTIILNNICTRAMKQSYPNAVPPVCLTRKETLLLQQNGSVEVPRYRC